MKAARREFPCKFHLKITSNETLLEKFFGWEQFCKLYYFLIKNKNLILKKFKDDTTALNIVKIKQGINEVKTAPRLCEMNKQFSRNQTTKD